MSTRNRKTTPFPAQKRKRGQTGEQVVVIQVQSARDDGLPDDPTVNGQGDTAAPAVHPVFTFNDEPRKGAVDLSVKMTGESPEEEVVVPESARSTSGALIRPRVAFEKPLSLASRPATTATSRPGTAMSNVSLGSFRSSIYSIHAPVGPEGIRPGTQGSYRYRCSTAASTILPSFRENVYTSSNVLLNEVPCDQGSREEEAVKVEYILPPSEEDDEDDYNEWRNGTEDPTEEYRRLKEISESIFVKEIGSMEQTKDDEETRYVDAYKYFLLFGRITENLSSFVTLPVPPGFNLQCRVTRVKSGMDGKIYPTYYMHVQKDGKPVILLMSAKRTAMTKTNYAITTNPAFLSSRKHWLATLKTTNIRRTEYLLRKFDDGVGQDDEEEDELSGPRSVQPFLKVEFVPTHPGTKGPRRIEVTLPKLKSEYEQCSPSNLHVERRGLDTAKESKCASVWNRVPKWNAANVTYMLNFCDRVQEASIKNFQLEFTADNDVDLNLLQFGRRKNRDSFILDFRFPFCPLQAFATALTSFDGKWGVD